MMPTYENTEIEIEDGDRVEGGVTPDDMDSGFIVEVAEKMARVAWDSGVTTWTPVCTLRFVR